MKDGGLRPLFRRKFKQWQWSSIETAGTQSGVPDSEYAGINCQGWIEFKETHVYHVQIKTFQVAWLMRRYRLNQGSFIAVRRTPQSQQERGVDELWLMGGDQAKALFDNGLLGVNALCWSGGPNAWNWKEIEQILIFGIGSFRQACYTAVHA